MISGLLSYHMIEAAQDLFGKAPAQLNGVQKDEAEDRARKSVKLQGLVLASPFAQGVSVPETSLENALSVVEKRYPDHKEYMADLARNGLNLDSLKEALQRELWAEAVLEQVAGTAPPVTDEEIQKAYEANKKQFDLPETRSVRHILITINPDFEENTRDAATKRLENLATELGPTPSAETFEKAALRHSECPSALNGGDLGRVPRGKLYAPLEEALFRLDEGRVSAVVETEAGLHLAFCESIHPAGLMPLEEAKPKIAEALQKRRGEATKKAWLSSLLNDEGDD